jgi:glycerol-3-phosphate dehydrogenase (NAD(P)+)
MIGVVGGGAWGTALAQVYAQAGHDVLLWAREHEVIEAVNGAHENKIFLPGVTLDKKIKATADLSHMGEKQAILLVTPAQHVRHAMGVIGRWLPAGRPVVICAKGIELQSGKMLSDAALEEAPQAEIAVLTGPTFASEIVRGLPSAVTLAAGTMEAAEKICALLTSRNLRPYASDDLTGAQIGGAVKNVIAIACGIVAGKGLGESGRAALLTRGLAEIARLSEKLGARRETLMGMCGVGDLMLTCSSMQSRNYSLGFMLGQGRTLEQILGERKSVTEGVSTAQALMVMAKQHGIDMPVARAVCDIVTGESSIDAAISALLDRPLRTEKA